MHGEGGEREGGGEGMEEERRVGKHGFIPSTKHPPLPQLTLRILSYRALRAESLPRELHDL